MFFLYMKMRFGAKRRAFWGKTQCILGQNGRRFGAKRKSVVNVESLVGAYQVDPILHERLFIGLSARHGKGIVAL